MDFILIASGLLFLIIGGSWLLKAAVGFSLRLNIPKVVIGMTVVSFATSAPELIVSLKAALDGQADLALGNVIGSNIANLGLVLGITTILSTISIQKSFYKIDWPVMMLSSIALFLLISFDGIIQFYEGAALVTLLIVFLVYLLKFQKTDAVVDELPEAGVELPLYKDVLFLALGGFALWGGSELLIKGSISMAQDFGVSTRVIGVTIVSLGTSIPELAASVIAVLKKEKAISLGNLIGSNIFNIGSVLGLTAMISPLKVDSKMLENDIFWMLGVAFILVPLTLLPKQNIFSRYKGFILITGYILFMYMLFAK